MGGSKKLRSTDSGTHRQSERGGRASERGRGGAASGRGASGSAAHYNTDMPSANAAGNTNCNLNAVGANGKRRGGAGSKSGGGSSVCSTLSDMFCCCLRPGWTSRLQFSVSTLNVVIATISILVTAGTTLCISLYFSINSANQLARNNVRIMADKAMDQMTSFLAHPLSSVQAINYAVSFSSEQSSSLMRLPSELYDSETNTNHNSSDIWSLPWERMQAQFMRQVNFSYQFSTLGWEDGFYVGCKLLPDDTSIFQCRSYSRPVGQPGSLLTERNFSKATGVLVGHMQAASTYDPRDRSWYTQVPRYAGSARWSDVYLSAMPTLPIVDLNAALSTSDGVFLGSVAFTYELGQLDDELKQTIGPSLGAAVVLLDNSRRVLASSLSMGAYSVVEVPRQYTLTPAETAKGCVMSDQRAAESSLVVCQHDIPDFGFEPLADLQRTEPQLLASPTAAETEIQVPCNAPRPQTYVGKHRLSGKNYFVARIPLQIPQTSNMNWMVLTFLPESEVTSSIDKGRNVAIGVAVSLVVVIAFLVGAAMKLLLSPLSTIASRMESAAYLRVRGGGSGGSGVGSSTDGAPGSSSGGGSGYKSSRGEHSADEPTNTFWGKESHDMHSGNEGGGGNNVSHDHPHNDFNVARQLAAERERIERKARAAEEALTNERRVSYLSDVAAIQKAYWDMADELWVLKSYVPEHVTRQFIQKMIAKRRGELSTEADVKKKKNEKTKKGGSKKDGGAADGGDDANGTNVNHNNGLASGNLANGTPDRKGGLAHGPLSGEGSSGRGGRGSGRGSSAHSGGRGSQRNGSNASGGHLNTHQLSLLNNLNNQQQHGQHNSNGGDGGADAAVNAYVKSNSPIVNVTNTINSGGGAAGANATGTTTTTSKLPFFSPREGSGEGDGSNNNNASLLPMPQLSRPQVGNSNNPANANKVTPATVASGGGGGAGGAAAVARTDSSGGGGKGGAGGQHRSTSSPNFTNINLAQPCITSPVGGDGAFALDIGANAMAMNTNNPKVTSNSNLLLSNSRPNASILGFSHVGSLRTVDDVSVRDDGDEGDGVEMGEITRRGGGGGAGDSASVYGGGGDAGGGGGANSRGGGSKGFGVMSMGSLENVTEAANRIARAGRQMGADDEDAHPIFFGDNVLVDRDISVVHMNVVGFHRYCRATHGKDVMAEHEVLVNLIHHTARKCGGVLDTFSGDKFYISFNAASKCVDHQVAALSFAYEVTSLVTADAIWGARRRKVEQHCRLNNKPVPADSKQFPPQIYKSAPFGLSCGVASGRAFVGPLGTERIRRHSVLSNAMTEAVALERLCMKYPACRVLIAGDFITEVDPHFSYLLLDAAVLPGTGGKRRRLASVKGPLRPAFMAPTFAVHGGGGGGTATATATGVSAVGGGLVKGGGGGTPAAAATPTPAPVNTIPRYQYNPLRGMCRAMASKCRQKNIYADINDCFLAFMEGRVDVCLQSLRRVDVLIEAESKRIKDGTTTTSVSATPSSNGGAVGAAVTAAAGVGGVGPNGEAPSNETSSTVPAGAIAAAGTNNNNNNATPQRASSSGATNSSSTPSQRVGGLHPTGATPIGDVSGPLAVSGGSALLLPTPPMPPAPVSHFSQEIPLTEEECADMVIMSQFLWSLLQCEPPLDGRLYMSPLGDTYRPVQHALALTALKPVPGYEQ